MQTIRLKNYVNGQWLASQSTEVLTVKNPSTGEVLAEVPLSTPDEVGVAVTAAQAAFPGWARTPVSTRVQYLFRLRSELEQIAPELTRLIVTEMGKSTADADAEVKRAMQNLEMACGMPAAMHGNYKVARVAADIDTETIRLPLGVFAGITPFNFPLMVPFWFFPYAIATGNTFILKTSEQTPLTMDRVFSSVAKLGLPPGVLNLIQGDRRVGEALLTDSRVTGVSFVGSTPVARRVAAACVASGKRCQALGSAKNYLVVMADADWEHTLANALTSCFGCAGQRCMAASVIACVGDETYQRMAGNSLPPLKKSPPANSG